MEIAKKRHKWFILILIGVVFSFSIQSLFAQAAEVTSPDVISSFDGIKYYPSLAPTQLLRVRYGAVETRQPINCNGQQKLFYIFDKQNPDAYVIVKDGDSAVNSITIQGADIDTKTAQHISYVKVDVNKINNLENQQNEIVVNVGLRVKRLSPGCIYQDQILWSSKDGTSRTKIKIVKIDNYTLQLKPDIVPDQALIDGTKKTVGQLQVKFNVPSIVTNRNGANLYFNTDNLISTNWKDKNSKVELRFGAERSLSGSWYIPGNIEAKINGDQRFKNATFVLSSGIKTNIPWRWTKSLLFNPLIKAPVSPIIEFSTQYHRRMKQDTIAAAERLDKNAFALFSQIDWSPIQIFPGRCKKDESYIDGEECFSANEISLELMAKGWYFPYEKAIGGTKVRKYEGRFEASLLIPISKFASLGIKGFGPPESGFNSRLRLTYKIGANDASGFKRSSQFMLGFEAIK